MGTGTDGRHQGDRPWGFPVFRGGGGGAAPVAYGPRGRGGAAAGRGVGGDGAGAVSGAGVCFFGAGGRCWLYSWIVD